MFTKNKVLLIIPAYNESKNIGNIIDSLQKKKIDFLVVNDGSTDLTKKILINKKVKFINHNNNKGYSLAIYTGINYAKKNQYKYLMTCDGDGQHSISDIKKLYNILNNNNYDIVSTIRNKKNRICEHLYDIIFSHKLKITDVLSGLKGYKLDFKLNNDLNKIETIGLLPLMIKRRRKNISIKEFKIKINDRKDKSKFGGFFIANLYLFRHLFICLNILRIIK